MASVDFTDWVAPNLVLTLGGKTYTVAPPNVAESRLILALAVRSEIQLGLTKVAMPPELAAALEHASGQPLGEITLGDQYQTLIDDGHAAPTIDRMAFYAMLYWARGKGRADDLAQAMWSVAQGDADADDSSGEPDGR